MGGGVRFGPVKSSKVITCNIKYSQGVKFWSCEMGWFFEVSRIDLAGYSFGFVDFVGKWEPSQFCSSLFEVIAIFLLFPLRITRAVVE